MVERRKKFFNRIFRQSNYSLIGAGKDVNKTAVNNTDIGLNNKVEIWLKRNNMSMGAGEFFFFVSIITSLSFLAGFVFRVGIFISFLLSGISIFIIFILIDLRSKKENIKKENQLEHFLIDLTGNLYANPNVQVSIQKTLDTAEYPLKKEFEIILDDTRRGILLNDAFRNMIRRNSSRLIESVIVGLIVANDKGVDLIEFLKDQIEYIREKRNIENYIKILSTGPKYTSYLIMLIPLVSIIIISIINKNYVNLLFSGIGLVFLIYAAVSYIIGFILINKIVNLTKGNNTI